MATISRVRFGDGSRSHTVISDTGLPVAPIEEYLAFLRADGSSPHTVQAYARGLAAWWDLLADLGHGWDDFPTAAFGQFLTYLRTGDLPSVTRVGPTPAWLAPATVTLRSAAVLAFYTWHAAAHGLHQPMARLPRGGAPGIPGTRRCLPGSQAPLRGVIVARSTEPDRGPNGVPRSSRPLRCTPSSQPANHRPTPQRPGWSRPGIACYSRCYPKPGCVWARRCRCATTTSMPVLATLPGSRSSRDRITRTGAG